jgi:hypothetical protein
MFVPVVRVKPWGEGQGAFVRINESDFDPAKHELYVEPLPELPAAPVLTPLPVLESMPDPLAKLPADWQEKVKSAELRGIAAAVSGRTVENREQAVQVISEALAARAK